MLTKEISISHLKYATQALSLEAGGQLASFPSNVVVPDELLLEFDNWKKVALANYPEYFSSEQMRILNDIEAFADKYQLENSNVLNADELKKSFILKRIKGFSLKCIGKI